MEAKTHFIETRHVIWCPHDDPRTDSSSDIFQAKINLGGPWIPTENGWPRDFPDVEEQEQIEFQQ